MIRISDHETRRARACPRSPSHRSLSELFVMLIDCCRRLHAISSLYRSLELLLGLLDGPQQSCGQSIVRRHTRHGHGCPHPSTGVKTLTTISSRGGLQLTLASPSSFSTGSSLPFVRRSRHFSIPAFALFHRSTRTSGTPLTFLYCPHTPSITLAKYTTSPGSSTTTRRSTSRLTRLTVLCSSLPPLPSHTDSYLRRSLPHSRTP